MYVMVYSLVFGFVTLAFGLIPKIVRPKKINSWYGYRTVLSTQNQDTWDEGNRYSTNQYIIAGIILIIIGRISYAVIGSKGFWVPLIAFIPVLMCTVFTTEKHLKKIFNDDGVRINKIN
ncbi:SdpI family protein [Clostridium sp. JN-1]|uniref:SdpI family protein n=1 Tax=Clostridium sp. JN-1 TaxID=2483110 RepID=UPI000F0B3D0E|nr:SdpI family protein [Clostridium sp. JN-1]